VEIPYNIGPKHLQSIWTKNYRKNFFPDYNKLITLSLNHSPQTLNLNHY